MALVDVHFQWDDEHGECYDCGRPAAYRLVGHPAYKVGNKTPWLRCSVCAAYAATHGEKLIYLDGEKPLDSESARV